ncbi:hypothetical protein PC123_g7068 [Phytophthora cactorum]|nr:hypothetical protein PC123_g7068 [Phytophthora cactorum]
MLLPRRVLVCWRLLLLRLLRGSNRRPWSPLLELVAFDRPTRLETIRHRQVSSRSRCRQEPSAQFERLRLSGLATANRRGRRYQTCRVEVYRVTIYANKKWTGACRGSKWRAKPSASLADDDDLPVGNTAHSRRRRESYYDKIMTCVRGGAARTNRQKKLLHQKDDCMLHVKVNEDEENYAVIQNRFNLELIHRWLM